MTDNFDFIAYLETLRPGDWEKMATSKWTVKDVVGHMVGWEKEAYQALLETQKTQKTPWFMQTEEYDEFNNRNVEYYKNLKPKELLIEWRMWQEKIQEEINRIGEDNLSRVSKESNAWVLDEGEDGHYMHHYKQIRVAIDK